MYQQLRMVLFFVGAVLFFSLSLSAQENPYRFEKVIQPYADLQLFACETNGRFVHVAGPMASGDSSRVVQLDPTIGSVLSSFTLVPSSDDFSAVIHAISLHGDRLYVTGELDDKMFVMSLDSDLLTLNWIRFIPQQNDFFVDIGFDIAVNDDGIYVTGDLDRSVGVVKVNFDQSIAWVISLHSGVGFAVDADTSGVYVMSVEFDSATHLRTKRARNRFLEWPNRAGNKTFVTKLDLSSRTALWQKEFPEGVSGEDIIIDLSGLYMTGDMDDMFFLAKRSLTNGDSLWEVTHGDPGANAGVKLDVDGTGLYVTGFLNDNVSVSKWSRDIPKLIWDITGGGDGFDLGFDIVHIGNWLYVAGCVNSTQSTFNGITLSGPGGFVAQLVPDASTHVIFSPQPSEFSLLRNYPNPFNPSTTITYFLHSQTHVELHIYDTSGKHVHTLYSGHQNSGTQSQTWDGTDEFGQPVSSGMYIVSLVAGGTHLSRKILFLK